MSSTIILILLYVLYLILKYTILKYNFDKIRNISNFFYLMLNISFIINYLKNPGICGREYFIANNKLDGLNIYEYQICRVCNIIIPKSFEVRHCRECGICIIGQQFHFHPLGKCIGKNNYKIFSFFCFISFFYFFIIVISFISYFYFIFTNGEFNIRKYIFSILKFN